MALQLLDLTVWSFEHHVCQALSAFDIFELLSSLVSVASQGQDEPLRMQMMPGNASGSAAFCIRGHKLILQTLVSQGTCVLGAKRLGFRQPSPARACPLVAHVMAQQ